MVLWFSRFGLHRCSGRILFAKTVHVFRDFVVDFLFVQNGAEVFVQGANKETCFGSSAFNTPVLFLKLNGTRGSLVHWE